MAVVTIVAIATFRMQPVYIATARIEIDRENSNILPFQGTDSYEFMMDMDNYIETQSRILTSETLALQTIRNSGLIPHAEMQGAPSGSEAITSGSLANHRRPAELRHLLKSAAEGAPAEALGSAARRHLPAIRHGGSGDPRRHR